MAKAFVDTGVFISVLNKESNYEKSADFLERILQKKIAAFISVITLSEILSVYYKASEKVAIVAKANIENIIGENSIVPVIKDIAEAAGKIKAIYKMSLGDALITATAIAMKCDYLVSLDPEIKKMGLIAVKEPEDAI